MDCSRNGGFREPLGGPFRRGRLLVEFCFGLFKYQTLLLYSRVPHSNIRQLTGRWTKPVAALQNASSNVDVLDFPVCH